MSEPIEFFYFDLGNVIYHFDYTISNARAAELLNREPQEIHRTIYNSGLEELFETGFVSTHRFVAECERSLGCHIDETKFLEATSDMFTFNHAIAKVVDFLRVRSIPIGLLSNTCPSHWSWITRQKDIDFGSFIKIIVSYEVGCMKPLPAIYKAAEDAANTPRTRIAFIDDRQVNIDAAASRGWQTLLYQDVESTLRWLGERV
jgi:putative hydrolase of the HAD superfamily